MSRPRPRPRPRPVATAAPSSPGPSSATFASPPPNAPNVEDEDAMFFRNRTRTAQTWKKLNEMDKANEAKAKASSPADSDAEDGNEASPRRKTKKKPNKDAFMPDWTKMSVDAILISSSDDDDDILVLGTGKKAGTNADQAAQKSNLKRQRSRSRSITPPPALPMHAIQTAREAVRRLIDVPKRPASPTYNIGDESTDTIVLDPELAKIASRVQAHTSRQQSFAPSSRSHSPVEGGGPENVTLKVRWISHPLNPSGRSDVWEFKIKRHDPLREIFDEVADATGVLRDNLIVSSDGKRVFPSASPHGIGVWAEAELEACDKVTHEYLRTHRNHAPPTAPDAREHSPSGDAPSSADEHEDDSDAESAAGGDKFKLTLRSGITKDITVTVRPTTKCSAIVKAFLKSAGLTDNYPTTPAKKGKGRGRSKAATVAGPMLMLDGEKMNPDTEIGEADLEDGDLVEVVGL